MNYNDFANELVGYVNKLPFLLAQRHVNRAWREIRDSRLWTFLLSESLIIIPAAVSAGTVNLVQFATTVTLDAAAQAAVAGLANPIITLRQFRVTGGAGVIYNITGYDPGTGIMTLDKQVTDATNAAQGYQIYQCYFPAPSSDFLRWVSIYNPYQGYWLKLHYTRREFDMRDPQRASFGSPYYCSAYKFDANNVPMFELWPHQTAQMTLQTILQRRGTDFATPTEAPPAVISDELLSAKSRVKAYEWAIANTGTFPELRGIDWRFLMAQAMGEYKAELNRIKKADEETFLQNYVIPVDPTAFLGPIDAKYIQSHDIS